MEQGFIVRQAAVADAPAMYRVFAAAIRGLVDGTYSADQRQAWVRYASPEYFAVLMAMEQHYIRVAIGSTGRVVAFGALHADEVSYLYVRPAAAGRGIGSALLRDMEAYATSQRVNTIRVRSSLTARLFYVKHGYEETGAGTYVRDGVTIPLLWMAKQLAAHGV